MPRSVPTVHAPRLPRQEAEPSEWKRFLKKQAWVKCRRSYLIRHPLCVECKRGGDLTAATEVHHTMGQSAEHAFDEDTFMALCKRCHARITRREQLEHASTDGGK